MTVTLAHGTPTLGKAQPITQGHNQQKLTPYAIAGLSITEFGGTGSVHRSEITLTNMALSITDAAAYGSQQLFTFPQGVILVMGCVMSLTFTTTSTLASTLNAGSAVQYGLGTAAASATTLATTMIDICPGSGATVPTFTSSTTVNVASTTVTNVNLAAQSKHDGSSTAKAGYLNLAVGTGTDIDGDATLTVSGTIIPTWVNLGAV